MHCANFPRHLGRLITRCLIAHPVEKPCAYSNDLRRAWIGQRCRKDQPAHQEQETGTVKLRGGKTGGRYPRYTDGGVSLCVVEHGIRCVRDSSGEPWATSGFGDGYKRLRAH